LAGEATYTHPVDRLRPAAEASRRWVTTGSRPVWITSVLLALLTWPIGIDYPGTGLDFSWIGGLYMAAHEGKHYGSEIIFTYGPLGFLDWPSIWYGWLAAIAFLYFSVMYLAFTATLTWALNRTVGLLAAAVVVFISFSVVGFISELPVLIAIGLCFAAMRSDRPEQALGFLAVGGGLLCAVEPLVKLSVGPPAALIVILGMWGAAASRRQWATFLAIAIGGFFTAWFVTGQGIGNLPDYVTNGIQIVKGYGEAMGYDGAETWEAVAIVVFGLALIGIIHRADFRDRRARVVATVIAAVASYVVFRYGTTQFGKGGPPVVALSTMVAIFMLAPWPRRHASRFLIATTILMAIVIHAFPGSVSLDSVPKLETFKRSVELAVRPGLRDGYTDGIRASMRESLAIPPVVLGAMEGKTVAVDPYEIAAAWAYELDWKPLPTFQNYSAYTAKLDQENAEAIESPDGPEVLLRQLPAGLVPGGGRPGFMGRQPLWDPPEQNLAQVCDFVPIVTSGVWQVLTRIEDRCLSQKLAESKTVEPGEAVPVPQAGHDELVVMRVHGAELEGFEKLRSLFWRPTERHLVYNGGEGSFRLVPGTSEGRMIVSADRSLDRNGDFAELPMIHSLAIEGASGPLEYSFDRVKLRPVRLTAKKK
jgi:hypothetical protein